MKKSDIAMIILIASTSLFVAYFVLSGILGKPGQETAEVQTIAPISNSLVEPDPKVFNAEAINPTVQVVIGQ